MQWVHLCWSHQIFSWTLGELELSELPPTAVTENWNWTPKLTVCISYFHDVSAVWKYKVSLTHRKPINFWHLFLQTSDLSWCSGKISYQNKKQPLGEGNGPLGPFGDPNLTFWKSVLVLCRSSVECCPADTIWWQLTCNPVYWNKGSGVSSATNTVKNVILTNLDSETMLINWQNH